MSEQKLDSQLPGYISSREAGKHFRVTNDYISRLCRRGLVRGIFVGKVWFIDVASLEEFFNGNQTRRQNNAAALSQTRREEYGRHISNPAPGLYQEKSPIENSSSAALETAVQTEKPHASIPSAEAISAKEHVPANVSKRSFSFLLPNAHKMRVPAAVLLVALALGEVTVTQAAPAPGRFAGPLSPIESAAASQAPDEFTNLFGTLASDFGTPRSVAEYAVAGVAASGISGGHAATKIKLQPEGNTGELGSALKAYDGWAQSVNALALDTIDSYASHVMAPVLHSVIPAIPPRDSKANLAALWSAFDARSFAELAQGAQAFAQNMFGSLSSIFVQPHIASTIVPATTTATAAETRPSRPSPNVELAGAAPKPKESAAAATAAVSSPSYRIYPVIERTVVQNGVSSSTLAVELNQLANALRSQIFAVMAAGGVPASGGVGNEVALSQNIGNLSGTTLSNITVHGVSGLAAADIPHDIVASNYLPLGGGTLTGALVDSGTASSTFAGPVGIGTTSPSDIFALNGAAYLADIAAPATKTNRLYANTGKLYWDGTALGSGGGAATTTANTWIAHQQFAAGASTTQLSVYDHAWFGATATSTFTSKGWLGLGTTSPGSLLSVGNTGGINFGTGTSTFSTTGGLNIKNGCFAINGACLSAAGLGGITSIGPTGQAQTGSAITLATSTTGSDFTITGSGSKLTFNLPSASATARGLLSSANWTLFNNKISSSSLSATAPLHYNASTGAFTVDQANASTNGYLSSTNWTLFNNKLGSSTISSLSSNYLPKWNGTADAFNNSSIYDNGNIGIGTTSPWAALSVQAKNGSTNKTLFAIGSSTASATTTLFSVSNSGLTTIGDTSGTGDADFQFASDPNAWSIGYASADKSFRIASSTNLTSRVALAISKSLNVGVGTTSPYSLLSVAGQVVGQNFVASLKSATSTFAGGAFFGAKPTSSTYGYAPVNFSNNGTLGTLKTQLNLINSAGGSGAGSAVDFYTYTNAGNGLPGARFAAIDDGNYSGDFQFLTKADGSSGNGSLTAKLVIKGGTGNVGVGTTSPGSLLSVGNTGGINFGAATSTFNTSGGLNIKNGCFAMNGTCLSATGLGGLSGSGTTGDVAYFTGSGSVGSNANFVFTGGKLGVGTTSPFAKLSVAGLTVADSFDATNTAATSTFQGTILAANGGNVGIGTTSPSATFGLVGSQYLTGGLGVGIVNTVAGSLQTTGNATIGGTLSGSGVVSAATEYRLSNFTYSRVATIDSSGGFGGGYNFNWNNMSPKHDSVGTLAGYGYVNDGSLRFYTDSSQIADAAAPERLRITSTGNVGIGTAAPSYKLDVAGFINTDQYSGYKQAGNTILQASSTNGSTLVGIGAGTNLNSTVTNNVALGYDTLAAATSTVINSVAIGPYALQSATIDNNAIGSNNDGDIAIGRSALQAQTTGTGNVAIGPFALEGNKTGLFNTAIGSHALENVTSSLYNTAIGLFAGEYTTTGSSNIAIGPNSFIHNLTGSTNIAIGNGSNGNNDGALSWNGSATNTIAIGYGAAAGTALYSSQGGVYLGVNSGRDVSTGSDYNTLLGYQSGYDITTGHNNVYLGDFTTTGTGITTGSSNIVIGDNVSAGLTQTGSGQLNIGNLIYGTSLGTGSTLSTGKVGIGTTTPWAQLSVNPNGISGPAFVIGSSTKTDFVVTNGGKVGIGSSTPAAPLSISTNGISKVLEIDAVNSGTSYPVLVNADNNTGMKYCRGLGAASPGCANFSVYSYGAVGINSDNVISLNPGNSQLLFANINGTVGIGPSLVANDSILTNTRFVVQGATADNTTAALNIIDSNKKSLFYILDNGNVGIGTTSPWAQLSVNPNGITGPAFSIGSSTKTDFVVTNGGKVGIGTSTPGSLFAIQGVGSFTTATSTFNASGGINLKSGCFEVKGACLSSGTNYWTLSGSDLYNNSGTNVGIGTSTPGFGFSVSTPAIGLYATSTVFGGNGGGVQAWKTASNALPATIGDATSVVANGYVYEIGGDNGGVSTVSTVYYAKLNADGSVGAWQTAANALPAGRNYATSVIANGYVYEISGYDGASLQSTVYYAKLNADGSVGAWQTAANALPAARLHATSVVANGYVYEIGGYNGGEVLTVYYAKLNADGSVGAWKTAANGLPAARSYATSVVANGYVYEIGGSDNLGAKSTVYYAKLNADGSVGAWKTASNALPAALDNATTIVANGYVYEIGGNNGGSVYSTVYYAKLNANGSVGAWKTAANGLPAPRSYATSIVANGYVYEIGGGYTTVYYASLARTAFATNLDLLGMASSTVGDDGSSGSLGSVGGSLYAGDIYSNGALTVTGNSLLSGGLGINGTFSLNATTSQAQNYSIFNIANATGTAPILTALYNGKVGVGTSTPDALLSVGSSAVTGNVAHFENSTGSCYIDPTTTSLSCSSDERLKKNITAMPASDGLGALSKLSPVFYNWKTEATGTPEHSGFIAQQVAQILPDLVAIEPNGYYTLNYAGFTPYLVKGVQELNLDLSTIASTTASSTPASQSFAESFFQSLFARMTAWLASAENGVHTLYASIINSQEVNTQTLCVSDATGAKTCITKAGLDALLANASAATSGSTASSAASTPPVITISGNNPARVAKGSSYSDLGATITGPEQDLNLGLHATVDGGATTTLDAITIDTSKAGTHTIRYFATDQKGVTGYATRTVVVYDPAASSTIDVSAGAASSTPSATTTASTATPPVSTGTSSTTPALSSPAPASDTANATTTPPISSATASTTSAAASASATSTATASQ